MAHHAWGPNQVRINDGETVIDALDTIHGARELDRAIASDIAGDDAPEDRAVTPRLDREALDADTAPLERSRDADGERRFPWLPGKAHA